MNFGAHISIAGGIEKAPERAYEIGGECFQIFSRSPHGGKSSELTEGAINNFKNNCRKYNLENYYIHTPYYINLASANNRIYHGSIAAIRKEMETADLLGAKGVITHLGSAKELGRKEAREKLVEGLVKVFLVGNKNIEGDMSTCRLQYSCSLLKKLSPIPQPIFLALPSFPVP